MNHHDSQREVDVLVIGAGFGGICAAIKLKKAGIDDLIVVDRAESVGGTWRDNHYPGAAVDISTLQYSLSFAPNNRWSRLYATQPELLDYINHVVDEFDLRRHLRLGVEITELAWDEDERRWLVSTSTGAGYCARIVVSATGILSLPTVPDIAGLRSFPGPAFHSAQWRHDVDLHDKSVAVVGSGASAVQFVPAVVDQTRAMTVFQRSPSWVYPRGDRLIEGRERWAHRHLPGFMRARRAARWFKNDLVQLGLQRNRKVVRESREAGLAHLRDSVPDPELRELLTPDYEPGCKRRVISDDWYPALQKPQTTVVKAGVDRIEGSTVIGTDETRVDADVIIFGTGFAATSFLTPMKIKGRRGHSLEEHWRSGASTHLGMTVTGFPNLFLVFGPNTGLGNNSALFMIECQAGYIAKAARFILNTPRRAIELKPDAERRSYEKLQRRFNGTVYTSGCHGWYQSEDGHVDTLWPATTAEYWLRTRLLDKRRYAVTEA